MNNPSLHSSRLRGPRNLTPDPNHRPSFTSIQDLSTDVALEDMDRNNPGQQVSNDTARAGRTENNGKQHEPVSAAASLPPRPPRPSRWRRSYQRVSRPIDYCYKIAKRKLSQPSDDKIGWKRTTFTLLTEQVGLALGMAPFVCHVLGYIGATVTYSAAAILCYYTNMVLYRFRQEYGAVTSICDIARTVIGAFGQWLTLFIFTLCAVMVAATHMREGGDFLTITQDSWTFAPLIWFYEELCPTVAGTVVIGFLILLVALPRNFRFLSVISMATVPLTIASVVGALGVLWAAEDRYERLSPKPEAFGFKNLPGNYYDDRLKVNAILCVVFTFLIHPTSPAVMSDMKNVNEFPKALRVSTGFQLFIFVLLGLLGSLLEGYRVFNGTVFLALPTNSINVALYGMIQPSVILQAGLFINVLGREVWQSFRLNSKISCAGGPRFSKYWWTRQGWWVLLLSFLVLLAWLIAGTVPNMDDLIGMVGAIPGCYLFFTIPAFVLLYEIRIDRWHDLPGTIDHISPRQRWSTYAKSTILFFIGVSMFCLGIWSVWGLFTYHSGVNFGGLRNPFTCADLGLEGKLVSSWAD